MFSIAADGILGRVQTDEAAPAYTRVAAALSRDISVGFFDADRRLKVRDLAVRYGVSPSPVREALQVLHGQGLVEFDPNCGASVRRLTLDEVNQACQINQALESFAARFLAETVSPHQIHVLREIDARHHAAAEAGEVDALADIGCDFHFAIYRFIRNPFVLRTAIVHTVLAHVSRREVGFSPERFSALAPEHTAILDAIEAQDCDGAGRLAYEHARSCTDDLIERFAERESAARGPAERGLRSRGD